MRIGAHDPHVKAAGSVSVDLGRHLKTFGSSTFVFPPNVLRQSNILRLAHSVWIFPNSRLFGIFLGNSSPHTSPKLAILAKKAHGLYGVKYSRSCLHQMRGLGRGLFYDLSFFFWHTSGFDGRVFSVSPIDGWARYRPKRA